MAVSIITALCIGGPLHMQEYTSTTEKFNWHGKMPGAGTDHCVGFDETFNHHSWGTYRLHGAFFFWEGLDEDTTNG